MSEFWKGVPNTGAEIGHYTVSRLANPFEGMQALRYLFPDGLADEMNFVLFSTSGVHGTYETIEEAEKESDPNNDVTFLVVQPRMVATRYGTASPITPDDFAFLKRLRQSSWDAVATIGQGERNG